MIKIH